MQQATEYLAAHYHRPGGVPEGRCLDFFATFDLQLAPEMAEARTACLRLLAGEMWCVFLIGGFGNGKTHLAIATLNEWTRQGGNGYFTKTADWLALLRRHVDPPEGEVDAEQLLDNYVAVPMLALDDLGAEKVTEWGGEQLYRLLDRRCDARRPTIVTSNAAVDALDPRIVSRLREGLVICRSPDVRGKL
jgi:DNA replication protein DnaC